MNPDGFVETLLPKEEHPLGQRDFAKSFLFDEENTTITIIFT